MKRKQTKFILNKGLNTFAMEDVTDSKLFLSLGLPLSVNKAVETLNKTTNIKVDPPLASFHLKRK